MKEKSPTERDSILDAVNEINKNYGAGTIQWLGGKSIDVERISTGCVSLDIALGGGIPKNRVIELYGNESGGKTTLALHIVSEFQKQGLKAAYIDAEHALDPQYAKKIGVDIDKLLISQPDHGEQALEVVEQLVSTGKVSVIVIDSVAALTPRAEIEGDMGASHMGLHARLMSQALRKLTALSSNKKCTLIFINQLRMKIGELYGSPETTTGGRALRFYASVRIDLRKHRPNEIGSGIDKIAVGNPVVAKIVKNKVAPPFRRAEFEIRYNIGIDKVGDILNVATKLGIIERKGAFYKIKGKSLQGYEKARAHIEKDQKLQQKLLEIIKNSYEN